MNETNGPTWLGADWGTSRLRIWAMTADGAVLGTRATDAGMGRLGSPASFTDAFRRTAADWCRPGDAMAVVVCGMAGAREGWAQAPYATIEAPLTDLPLAAVSVGEARPHYDVRILPGLAQSDPPDVMRGEETTLLGLVAANPQWRTTVVMPGTHSKWARVDGGRVNRFHTAMTGETFAALAQHTVLRHTVHGDGFDRDAFVDAVADAQREPAALLRRLFGLRAHALLHGLAAATARSRLSGWLTGLEITDALAQFGSPARVTLIATSGQSERYAAALQVFDVQVDVAEADALTRAGLAFAYRRLFGDNTL